MLNVVSIDNTPNNLSVTQNPRVYRYVYFCGPMFVLEAV